MAGKLSTKIRAKLNSWPNADELQEWLQHSEKYEHEIKQLYSLIHANDHKMARIRAEIVKLTAAQTTLGDFIQ